MKTEITALLGTEYPIIQGGMAWVAEHHLAAAVSEAGGLGIIGAANAPADWVREQIHKVRELTKKPFGVNVMLMSPYAEEVAKVIARKGSGGNDRSRKSGKIYGTLEKRRNKGDSGSGVYRSCEADGALRSRCRHCGRL